MDTAATAATADGGDADGGGASSPSPTAQALSAACGAIIRIHPIKLLAVTASFCDWLAGKSSGT